MVVTRWPLAALLGLAAPPAATWPAEVVLRAPGTAGWRTLEFPRIERHTAYSVVDVEGTPALRAQGDCSAAALYRPLEHVDLAATPRLQWRWKIERGLVIADERVKAGDDFAARVYVMFRFEPSRASLWERARRGVARVLYGEPLPGNTINYVWSSHEPAGARWDNPFAKAAKMVSRGPGEAGQWRTETVDVAADYVSLFGHRPPPLLGIAVMTDSDNSCQEAAAYYADFRFLSR